MSRIASPPSPRLDVRDLRVVLALASAGTTARAAELLHLTQPAVSRALLAAEDRLGVRLFDRTPRGLVPTAAGAQLAGDGNRLLGELCDLELRLRSPGELPARLRLVCECYTAYHWLPTALLRLRELLPELELQLAVEHTRQPIAALAADQIDVALLTTAPVPSPLGERELFADEVVFVVSADHPLAGQRALTPRDLRSHTLLSSPLPLDEQRWFMARVFGKRRPKLKIERLPLTEAIIDVARAGLGVAILSEWIAAPHLGRGDLVARRLASGPLQRPWRLAWRPDVAAIIPRLCSALAHTVPHVRLAA